MKRGASGLCGVLAIDKPKGVTSHDVVNAVRRLTGERRVGHAGTLDPMATGLLLVCVGAATRLSPYLTGHDKSYTARIVFGAATDTDDAEGRVVTAYTHAEPGDGLAALADVEPQEVLASIVGTCMQLPPAYSAIKKNGVTAYKAAREGKEIELDPREVTIYSADFLEAGFEAVDLDDGQGGRFTAMLPYWDVDLSVSKGTYIRSIARDLGQRLGCGAHLSALRRTKVGDINFMHAPCCSLESLADCLEKDGGLPWIDPVATVATDGVAVLSDDDLKLVSNGRPLPGNLTQHGEGALLACVYDMRLMALYRDDGKQAKPEVVIPGGVAGVRNASLVPDNFAELASVGDLVEFLSAGLGAVIVMGVFDGLHLGHRKLIADAYVEAQKSYIPLVVLTFKRDPDEFFRNGGKRPKRFKLGSNAMRYRELLTYCASLRQEYGSSAIFAIVEPLPTSMETLAQPADEFLECLGKCVKVRAFYVGDGFRYGAKAAGTTATLGAWCEARGAELHVHQLIEDGDEPVSSTRIRNILAKTGDVQEACRLRAGHMHHIRGRVVHGRGEGTDMGFATANLALEGVNNGVMLPLEGVYAGYACVYPETYDPKVGTPDMLPAAINLGVAKSFDDAEAEVEVHVIGLQEDIYGKVLDVWFAKRLREQRVFEDVDELVATVTHDIDWVRCNLEPIKASSPIDPEALAEY